MASQELKIKVSQVLQGGNALKETRKEVAELKAALFTLESQGKKNTAQYKQFEASLVSANGKLKAHNTEMKNLTGATNVGGAGMLKFAGQIGAVVAGVTVAIAAIVKLGTEILNLAKSGAEFNVLKKGFEELSGGSDIAAQNMELFRKSLAGNLSDAPIMKMANGFKLLGIDANTTAQVFDLAERNTELLGGTIEEVVEKMKKFVVTGTGKGFEKFGVNINEINKQVEKNTGLTDKQIKALDEEERVRLGLNAFMQLHGKSIEEIKNKKMDEADAIQFLITQYENVKIGIMSFVSTALSPMITVIQGAIDKFQIMFGNLVDGNSKVGQFAKTIIEMVQKGFEYFVNVWTSKVWPAYQQLFKAVSDAITKHQYLIPILEKVGKAFIDIAAFLVSKVISALASTITLLSKFGDGILDVIKGVAKLIGYTTGITAFFNAFKLVPSNWWTKLTSGLKYVAQSIRDLFNIKPSGPIWAILKYAIPGLGALELGSNNEGKGEKIFVDAGDDFVQPYSEEDVVNLPKPDNKDGEKQNKGSKVRTDNNEKETESVKNLGKEVEKLAIQYKEIALIAGLPIGKAHGKNRGPVDLKPLNPRQKDIEQNEEIERLLNSAMNNFDGMVNATATMLQNLGLMETGFGQILNGVIQVINIFKSAFDVGSSIFGFIGDIISLLPGGGIAGGILKTVGGSSGGGFASGGQIFGAGTGTSDSILARLSNGEFIVNAESTKRNLALLKAINGNQQATGYAYASGGIVRNQSMSPNITVVVNSEVESTKAIKFYQNTFDKYQSRLNKKRL